MFGKGHIAFIIISLIMILCGAALCFKRKPPVEKVLKTGFFLAAAMEMIKMLLSLEIVPVVELGLAGGEFVYRETGRYSPYLLAEHLPFELCSLQIVFLFLAVVIRSEKWKKRIYSVIYGTALIGGTMAILLSSLAPEYDSAADFLSSPRAWEFFIYHAMIIVIAVYIGFGEGCDIHFGDCKWMIAAVALLDFASFYLNSMLSVPAYLHGRLIGLEYAVNFFSSYNNPLGIVVREKWQYMIYLAIRLSAAIAVILLVYLPLYLKDRRRHQ